MLPYLPYATQDPKLQDMFRGLIGRQAYNVLKDPYANAYNKDGVCSQWWGGWWQSGWVADALGGADDLGAQV